MTAGGLVLSSVGKGRSLPEARAAAYRGVENIAYTGRWCAVTSPRMCHDWKSGVKKGLRLGVPAVAAHLSPYSVCRTGRESPVLRPSLPHR